MARCISSEISFSRNTNATYVNSQGYIAYAPNNALLNSEATSFAAWNISPTGTLGLTRTLATGTINGYNYVDITWSGTANANGTIPHDPNTSTGIIIIGQGH